MAPIAPDTGLIKTAWRCKCPRCGTGDLYHPGFSMRVRDVCPQCDLNLSAHDSADGPAVFLIFILGFLLVPLALAAELVFAPPLWAHALGTGILALGLTLGSLRPLKAYVIALQYKHRPETME